jgi:hypothetical protein
VLVPAERVQPLVPPRQVQPLALKTDQQPQAQASAPPQQPAQAILQALPPPQVSPGR